MEPSTRNWWGTLQIVAIRGCVGWGLLGPLGVRPGSGRTVCGCLLQGLPCSSSTRVWGPKLSVSSGVPQNTGSLQGGTLTQILSPPLTAGESSAQLPALSPGSQAPPPTAAGDGSWPAPLWTHPPRADTHGWAAASPLRGARPWQLPRAGRTLHSRSTKPHPESLPASRRGGAFAGGLCPRELRRTGQAGGNHGTGQGPPAHGRNCGSLTDWHPRMAAAVSHPILAGSSHPPGSTKSRRGLLPSPNIPNSGTNLPLHQVRSW